MDMKRFVKKNTFLVGVLGCTVLLVIVLLVFAVIQLLSWRAAGDEVAKMRKSVNSLLRQKPAAVAGNLELLQQDIDGYTLASRRLEEHFGHPYRIALRKFIEKLDFELPKTDDSEEPAVEPAVANVPEEQKAELVKEVQLEIRLQKFEEMFREFWEQEKSTKIPPDKLYRNLRALGEKENATLRWPKENWDRAFAVFCEEVAKLTLEPISDKNNQEIFLAALGLPRMANKNDDLFNVFAREIRSAIVDQLEKQKVRFIGVSFTGEGKNRNSGEMQNGNSREEHTSLQEKIAKIRDWENTADLLKRISTSGVISVEDLASSSIYGKESGDYRYHTYTFTVRGTPTAIRKLLNDLMQAYQENRVYVVRSINLKKVEDQAQDLIDFASGVISQPQEEEKLQVEGGRSPGAMSPGAMSPGAMSPGAMTPGAGAMRSAPAGQRRDGRGDSNSVSSYFLERGIYGEIVIGRSELCDATLTVNYVTFIKNELKDE